MIARGGTWDTNLKVVARKTPRRAMPVPYKSLRKDPFFLMASTIRSDYDYSYSIQGECNG